MSALPSDFLLLLLGFCAGAFALAITGFLLRQRRVNRLKDGHRDHLRQSDEP
ncbi:MAG: hypothetical protein K2K30_04150 [Alistipes sp.]|nr:hypothetical protein [Alistipes sp.]MDE6623563.1 hypothetical protein [Alistipes sp.]